MCIRDSKYLSYGKKIVKIGPVDAEIYSVNLKKEEITGGKYIAHGQKMKMKLMILKNHNKNMNLKFIQ